MYLIVGCGLSGAVLAERIATILKEKVLILEKRNHIAGNCYDYRDADTNILMNEYGAHLFHTNSKRVWEYIQPFAQWVPWHHTVLSYIDNKFVPIPVNETTISLLCNKHFSQKHWSETVQKYLEDVQIKCTHPKNSEEMALSRVGRELYEKLFKPYTYKQWAKYPEELDPSVLERIPVRTNADPRYFTDQYQALPKDGYTEFVKKMLNDPLITVKLNTDFNEFRKDNSLKDFKAIIYTGPIDEYFKEHNLEKLEYRSIHFCKEVLLPSKEVILPTKTTVTNKNSRPQMTYFQPNSVVNYPEEKYPYTRIVEYKHFLNQESDGTVIVYEETCDNGEPYYPVPTDRNKQVYEKYRLLAEKEEKEKNVFFVGRLANYKYFNMDQAIENALDIFEKKLSPPNKPNKQNKQNK